MRSVSKTTLLEKAHSAAGRGDWQQAYDLLSRADVRWGLEGPELGLLADVAYATGHLDVTIDAWERAHAQGVRAGDLLLAGGAAVRVAMHLLFDTALMAPVRGWIKRAERLLPAEEDTPFHAWLAVVRNYERLLSGDFQEARQWAVRAIELGTKHELAAAAVGRVAEARSLILEGEVSLGLDLLNEAGVATTSGELDPLSTGIVYCELVCALQGLAQYDLAEEWTQAMEHWRRGQPVGSVHGRCRVHRAEILRLRGSHVEAESEALSACDELRPYLRRELGWPLNELGRIRLRRGDIRGAKEAFLAAYEMGWDPHPGLGLVQLAEGDPALAAASIRQALERPANVPSKELPPNTELRRAPLLEALVEIEVEAGNLGAARTAVEELARIAASFQSKSLAAGAALAKGRVQLAEGEVTEARAQFETALRLWNEIGAPYEMSVARMGLARSYRAEGNEEDAIREFRLADAGFEHVGALGEATKAAKIFGDARPVDDADQGLQAPPASATGVGSADGHVFRREGDYWTVVFERRTARLRDLKGMRYLAQLLAHPGRSFHALELIGGERGAPEIVGHEQEPGLTFRSPLIADQLLDARAKEAYRRRLQEIEDDIEEARAIGNDERAEQAEVERDFLIRELARAVGLGGRDRRTGSTSERSRVSVTRAIRLAMARIREHHSQLGEHLDRAVRTGTYCAYLPDPRVPEAWKL